MGMGMWAERCGGRVKGKIKKGSELSKNKSFVYPCLVKDEGKQILQFLKMATHWIIWLPRQMCLDQAQSDAAR